MKLKSLLPILFVWPLVVCNGGTVRLLNGENYEAKVTVDGGGINVARDNTFSNRLDPNIILEVVFGKPSVLSGGLCPSGVLLVNGTFVACDVKSLLASLTDPTVKVGKGQVLVSTASIARVVCSVMPAEKAYQAVNGRTGVILSSGDFCAGVFGGFKNNKIAINPEMFEPLRLQPNEVGALVLRDVQTMSPARYEVIAKDGSRYLVDDPRFEGDSVSIRDAIFGQVKIPKDDLAVFRAGSGRYQFLAKLKPMSVNAPAGATDAVRFLPASPTDADQTRAIVTAVNASVSYAIPAGMNVFAGRIAVPKDVPPTMRFLFAVYVDGRLISKSSLIGSGDIPQTMHVNLGVGRVLTLRLEPAGPVVGAPFGKWIEPMLLRS